MIIFKNSPDGAEMHPFANITECLERFVACWRLKYGILWRLLRCVEASCYILPLVAHASGHQ